MSVLVENSSNVSLIVTLGKRLHSCALKVVAENKTLQVNGSNDSLVFGYSLVYSREYQPGGQVVFEPIEAEDYCLCTDVKVNGLYDVDQLEMIDLKAHVKEMWQEFREHIARVKAFTKEPEVTRDQIVILADTWDLDCSYLLIPVLYCLKEMAIEANGTEITVILDTSHFSSEGTATNQEALMFRLINQIEYRIDPNPKLNHDPLLEKLGYSDDLAFDGIRFFVVNNEKEGSLFAKSHQEIEDVIYSFLLGFVDPQLRDSLLEGVNPEYQVKNRTFFSSFGSVGMFVNPQLAIDCCGLRLSSEILQKGFLDEQPPDRELVKRLSDDVISKLGGTCQWYQELIKKPDFSVIKVGEFGCSIAYNLPPIPFVPPHVDQIELCEYIEEVDKCYKSINEKLFGEMDYLQSHIHIKANSILTNRKSSIDGILKQPDLMPDYLSNVRFVLKFVQNELNKRLLDAKDAVSRILDQSIIQKQFDEAKKKFLDVLNSIAPPPVWLQRVPEGGIKNFFRMVLKILQATKYLELDKARRSIERNLACLISNPYEKALAEFNLDVADQSIKMIEQLEQTLNKFEKDLFQFKEDYDQRLELKKTQLEPENVEPGFVYNPLTEPVCDKLYSCYKPKDSLVLTDLVFQKEWASRYIESQEDNLSVELLEYSNSCFSGIYDLSLSQIIEDYAEEKLPGDSFYKRLTSLTDRALLLLNPESFVMGENAKLGCISSALVSKNGEDFWEAFMSHQTKKWKLCTSVSAHIASFTTVQHGFSYNAIEQYFAKGKEQWDALSDAEKQQYDIIPDKDKKPPRAKAEFLHDGIWRITYNWYFTPSGSTKTYPFEASIEVDQTNYKKLVNRERYNGRYHLYAEENSAEIDQLVEHFKKIQWQYKWDSYDQASNVLSFVQSFISYRYDKDTKFLEEYPRYPLETLWDRVGDCEDFAILSGAILSRLGFKVALLLYPNPAHLAFGVETSKTHKVENLIKDSKYDVSYYYGEGTSKGWQLGDIPQDFHGSTPDFYRINESSWLVTPDLKEPEPEPKTE